MKLSAIRNLRPAKAAAVLAVVAGAVVASVLPSSADVSTASPSQVGLRVESPAHLVSRGAAVRVDALVTCPAGRSNYVYIRLVQRAGSGIASANAYVPFTCTGGFQTVTATLTAQDEAFKTGTAHAAANTSGDGTTVYDEREIEIVK